MITFCKACDAPLQSGAAFCSKCGTPVADAPAMGADRPQVSEEAVALPIAGPAAMPSSIADAAAGETAPPGPADNGAAEIPARNTNWLLIGGAIGTLLVISLIYFMLFVRDDLENSPNSGAANAGTEEIAGQQKQLFAMTEANIRDKPTTVGSVILGKMPRGSAVTGRLVNGSDDPASNWLELADGKGYISAVNLSDAKPPELVKLLNDKVWTADVDIDIWKAPDSTSELVTRANSGTKLTLSGLTANDFIEVKLKSGGVGYIANAADIMARVGGKPIALSFNPNSCDFGPEISAIFNSLAAQSRKESEEAEDRDYPNDDARDAALSRLEGKSYYQKLQRSFNGLSVTGVAQHYESQSVYFADPPAKVIEIFRSLGFKIDNGGQFPTGDLYAGIVGTRGEGAAYGKSELSCGV